MGRVTCWSILAMIGVCVASGGRLAWAQYDGASQQTPLQRLQQLPVVDLKGTVEEVEHGQIAMKCDGQKFVLTVEPSYTRVQCNGTAERAYLRPGVLVRFAGNFDKKMQAQAPIDELYVVTPGPSSQPGIHADEPEEDAPARGRKRGGDESVVVVGTIKLVKDDQLQVIADGKNIKVELGKEAEIKVEVDDHTLAAAGDEITVRGRTIQPAQGQQAGRVFGEEVTIALAKPLEGSTKAPAKKKKSSSKSAKRASRS